MARPGRGMDVEIPDLLSQVQEGERSVGELASELDLTLSNVSWHLWMMYDPGGQSFTDEKERRFSITSPTGSSSRGA